MMSPRRNTLTSAEIQRIEALRLEMDEGGAYQRMKQRERYLQQRHRERLRMLALPMLITIILLFALALAAVLLSPRVPSSPYGDAIGEPEISAALPPAPLRATSPVEDLRAEAAATAARERIPPGLLEAVIHTESRWKVNAVGAAGERGLMQLMPRTARSLGVDPHDVRDNLRGGAMYLRRHYERTGDWTRALARYNGRGPKARAYAERVLRAWEAGE